MSLIPADYQTTTGLYVMGTRLRQQIIRLLRAHQYLTGIELCEKISAERVTTRDYGPISFVVSLFSEKAALELLALPTPGVVFPTLIQLEDEREISSEWEPGSYPRKRVYRLTSSPARYMGQQED